MKEESESSMAKAAELFEAMGMGKEADECRRYHGRVHEPPWHKVRKGLFMEVPKPINEMSDEEMREFAIEFLQALKAKR